MFSLSEYLSRCQPGPGEGSDGVWVLALRWGGVHTDGGYQTVNGLYWVKQGGGLRQYHGAAHHRRRPEHPEEHPV